MAKNYAKPTLSQKWRKLATWKKAGVIALSLLLLAAIVFGIVWSTLDHSFRYDKEDLSSYIGAVAPDDCKDLPLTIKTDVTNEKIWADIQTTLTAKPLVDTIRRTDIAIAKDDILSLYYRVCPVVVTPASGETPERREEKAAVQSSTLYADEAKAALVRVGTSTLHSDLDAALLTLLPNASGSITRRADGAAVETNDYLVLTLKGTYKKNGADTVYLDLKELYLKGDDKIVADTTINASLREQIAGKTVGTDLSFTLRLVPKAGEAETEVTFTGKINAAISVTEAVKEIKLTKELSYTGSDGKTAVLAKDSYVNFYYVINYSLRLDEATVRELDASDESYSMTAGLSGDELFAADYLKHVQKKLNDAYVANLKKTENADQYHSILIDALWEEICKANTPKAAAYPAGTVEKYVKVAMTNFEYEYYTGSSADTYQKSYATLEEFILISEYGETKNALATLSLAERKEKVKSYIEKDAKEQISRKLVLYTLADNLDITVSKKDMNAKREELTKAYTDSFYQTYDLYRQWKINGFEAYTSAELQTLAKINAEDAVKELTTNYIRELVFFEKTTDAILELRKDANGEYQFITWDKAEETDA